MSTCQAYKCTNTTPRPVYLILKIQQSGKESSNGFKICVRKDIKTFKVCKNSDLCENHLHRRTAT